MEGEKKRVLAAFLQDLREYPDTDGDQSLIPALEPGFTIPERGSAGYEAYRNTMKQKCVAWLEVYRSVDMTKVLDKEGPRSLVYNCLYANMDLFSNALFKKTFPNGSRKPRDVGREMDTRISARKMAPLHIVVLGARRAIPLYQAHPEIVGSYYYIALQLLWSGAHVDARDVLGATPLVHALDHGHSSESLALAPLFIKKGADINAIDRFGYTILHMSLKTRNLASFRILVNAGASFNVQDRHGMTGYDYLDELNDGRFYLAQAEADARRAKCKTLCDYCGLAGADKRCSRCMGANYCSQYCQKKDWKRMHKKICIVDGGSRELLRDDGSVSSAPRRLVRSP